MPIIQLLDNCLRSNKIKKIAPLKNACLDSLLKPAKGCNFSAPLALIQQFLIALFTPF